MSVPGPADPAKRVDVAGLMAGRRFLHSGEFHYFRVARTLWRPRLAQMRDVGLNAVSIYVPWNWHMPVAGLLDLTGETLPERDLVGCLTEIASTGLACVLRPGPFITAEWRGGGIPDWLLERYPEIRACAADGKPVTLPAGYPAVTYSHPRYVAAASRWMRDVLGAAVPFLAGNGGPIINVQLDDETSYWATLGDPVLTDYNPYLVEPDGGPSRYAKWLLSRYGDLAGLNAAHHTAYRRADDVQPPQEPLRSITGNAVSHLDWHNYKLSLINEHCALLYQQVRAAGVGEPISMLFPYLLPLQARQFSRFMAERGLEDIWLTNECYLALFSSAAISEHKLGAVV
ncbi:MAG: beta-galactosidase, partial [Kutzneria sp.]|nr:beta-galactosidase [Kutzneria sp.]